MSPSRLTAPSESAQVVYRALRTYYLTNGIPPTVRELTHLCKRNVSTVQIHLGNLAKYGWIRRAGPQGTALSRAWVPVKDTVRMTVRETIPNPPDVQEAEGEASGPP